MRKSNHGGEGLEFENGERKILQFPNCYRFGFRFANYDLGEGVNLYSVAGPTGHKDIKTT